MKEPIAAVTNIHKTGTLTVTDRDGKEVTKPVALKLGGDGKYASDAIMHMGPGAGFGCHRCDCPTAKFLETRPEELKKYKYRTLESVKRNGHMVSGFFCEGCQMHVVATEEEAKEMNRGLSKKNHKAIRVCTGDPMADPKRWKTRTVVLEDGSKKKVKWDDLHNSIRYGGDGWYLIWDVELDCCIPNCA